MTPPIWRDEDGKLVPTRPCTRCGAMIPVKKLLASTLRVHGWQPYGLATWVTWCGRLKVVQLAARVRRAEVEGVQVAYAPTSGVQRSDGSCCTRS